MRIEVIRCDVCKKEHDAQYVLPSDWITTRQNTAYGIEEEKHFCSKGCVVVWASSLAQRADDKEVEVER